MKNWYYILLLSIVITMTCCSENFYTPTISFSESSQPKAPDYGNIDHWAAHPDKKDLADRTPNETLKNEQASAPADVFFIHPTTLTGGEKRETYWIGDVNDSILNKKTDESTILYQASIFNSTGRIYAPRYRQSHIYAYYTPNQKKDAKAALEFAYQDVKSAFQYYLDNHNEGRPIVIAAHSQGATHGIRLVSEFIDNKPLREKFVVAYLVGMPIPKDTFQTVKPCETPTETACFCSWNTYAKNYFPPHYRNGLNRAIATNPLTWVTTTEYADKALNKGAVLQKFEKIKKQSVDAQSMKGLLWINKPHVFGRAFLSIKNYHIGDFNLFYVNIRENAEERVKTFLEKKTK